jgi:hypothetical protein
MTPTRRESVIRDLIGVVWRASGLTYGRQRHAGWRRAPHEFYLG